MSLICLLSVPLSLSCPIQASVNVLLKYAVPLAPRPNTIVMIVGESITQARHHSAFFNFLNDQESDMRCRDIIAITPGVIVSGSGYSPAV
jgi:hypothetical protein